MPFLSLTRLRIRSVRFLPAFALYTYRSLQQVRRAAGFEDGSLLADREQTFWTLTAWDTEASMRAYMLAGAHKIAMPKLMEWCDEASVAHWTQETCALPNWATADLKMRQTGRASKVRHPSPNHAALNYREPRVSTGGPIRPARP